MLQGIVRWFDTKRGFGFIDSGDKDYFVHFSEIAKEGYKNLKEKEKVSFMPGETKRGRVATKVTSV